MASPGSEPTIATSGPESSTQVVDAYVVPTERGAALFVAADYGRLDARDGPFQIAAYSPYPLSGGELALVRARFEADLFDYAARAVDYGRAWKRQALLALLELTILGLLVVFLILNPSRTHFLIGWALPVGFFVATVSALRAFARRKLGQRARRLLVQAVLATEPAIARFGGSAAFVRDLWRALERGQVTRDTISLEHTAGELLHWPAGAAFYRAERLGDVVPAPRGWRRKLARRLLGPPPRGTITQMVVRAP